MSINIDRRLFIKAITTRPLDKIDFMALWGHHLAHAFNVTNIGTMDEFADKGILACYTACGGVTTGGAYLRIRDRLPYWIEGVYSVYWTEIAAGRSTSDHGLWKTVNGSATQLGTEAVDLEEEDINGIFLSAVGTTIKSGRVPWGAVMPHYNYSQDISYTGTPITVTDSDIASGAAGIADALRRYGNFPSGRSYWCCTWVHPLTIVIRDELGGSPYPPAPKPLAYFEVPITEKELPEVDDEGYVNITTKFYTIEDLPKKIKVIEKPVRNKILERKIEILKRKGWTMEEIREFLPEAFPVEKINPLAVTWSALIPCDKSGKPKNSTAIVRVFPSSPEYCYPIEKRIQAISEMRGVRKLSREEAIRTALKMDDKLHIHDLVPCTKHELGGKCYKEYVEWRVGSVGEKPEFAETKMRMEYVKGYKGW